MTDFLHAHLHVAKLGSDAVLLDARSNAYFCLPGAADVLQVDDRRLQFGHHALREAFVAAGFVTLARPPSDNKTAPRVRRDLGVVVADRLRTGDLVLILAAWLSMAVSYHRRSFAHLLETARRQGSGGPHDEPTAEALRLTAAFERVLPWLPFQGVCLYRAFLLRRILHWRNHATTWVFGVQTWPFHAHCWLQIGETALDDTSDRLTAYQPILAI